jgi:outer membrane receptor protein involved in Fe transport
MKTVSKPLLRAACALAPFALTVPSVALAQGEAPAAEEEYGGIPEIVVSARKVEESLSDAPVSVSVVDSAKISELGLNSIDDFAKQSTGISFSQAFGRTTDRPVIRGQSNVLAGVQFGVETGAAYFVDGIYYQGDIQGFDPESIQRVEIIKGPQSALYGRNTYSGAINYVTKDPSSDFSGSLRATVAEYDEYQVAGSISGPIAGDALGFRAGARHYSYGGQYRNQLTGKKVGQEESTSAYLTLVANVSDDLKVRLRGAYQKDKDGPLAVFLTSANANNCKPGFRSLRYRQGSATQPALFPNSNNDNQYYCGPIRAEPGNVRLNTDPVNTTGFGLRDGTAFDGIENEQYLFSGIIDWDIGGSGWTVSSMTGYRDNKNLFGTDSDHSEAFFFLFPSPANALATTEPAFANTNRDDQTDFSQEIRIASPVDAPFRGLIGGYYYLQKIKTVDLTFANPRVGEPLGSNSSAFSSIENKAVFGLLAADITDRLTVTGEIRYAEETKTVLDRVGTVAASQIFCAGEQGRAAQFSTGITGTIACRDAGKFTGWDPRVTVDYKVSDDVLLYATYAQGRKPGGFNGTGGLSAIILTGEDLTRYEQEKAKGGEFGIKFDALDRTLRVSASAFYNELTNVQLTRSLPPSAPGQATTSVAVNSGDAETKGFELEVQAAPSRDLNITLGFSYVDAKFTRGCDFDFFVLNSGGLQPNFNTASPNAAGLALCDISGKQLPLGAKFMVNGAVSWEKPLGNGGLRFLSNATFSFEDKKYIQTDNLAYVPSAFLLNARLGIKTDRFSLVAFGRNLTNEDAPALATRWFDYRYGNGVRDLPAAPVPGGPRFGTFNGAPAVIDTGAPRAFFAPLRKGRTFGIEGTFNF